MENDRNRNEERDDEAIGRSGEDIVGTDDELDDADEVDQDVADEEDMEEE